LGESPAQKMRNWNIDYPTFQSFAYGWINASSQNNFLIVQTKSWMNRIFGTRYGCNRDAATATLKGSGPTWDNSAPCYGGRLYLRGKVEYGLFFPKIGEFFEYTDKVAGIGFGHIVRAEFTGEETILCRAEAYVYLNRFSDAIADLKTFDDSRKITGKTQANLTEGLIRSFYTTGRTPYVNEFNTEKISSEFKVSTSQKALIDCILHYRRIETIFDGYRWFDIKRYGIEITHNIGTSFVDILKWNDPRRALQIPQEVIAAGIQENTRQVVWTNPDIVPFTTPSVRIDSIALKQ